MLPRLCTAFPVLLVTFGCLDFASAGRNDAGTDGGIDDTSIPSSLCAYDATCALSFAPFVSGVMTLQAWPQYYDGGTLTVNGYEARPLADPLGFFFDWGDGFTEKAYYARSHAYGDTSRSYVVSVTATYDGGTSQSRAFPTRFVGPVITPTTLPSDRRVTIPSSGPLPPSRIGSHSLPSGVALFPTTPWGTPRPVVEYVLTAAAILMDAMVRSDLALVDGAFRQVMLHLITVADSQANWFTRPPSVSFGGLAPDNFLLLPYQQFFLGMAQNFMLSTPARFTFAGRIEGATGSFLVRPVSHILAYATAYELVNDPLAYGLPADLVAELRWDLEARLEIIRRTSREYVETPLPFKTWDVPGTLADESWPAASAVVHRFLAHAEAGGKGYGLPALRMMSFLRRFDESILSRYAVNADSASADTFRATYMVAALSYAFETDLREEFRMLFFPIDDATFTGLNPL